MSQTYDRFQFVFPPRVETAIDSWDSEAIKLWKSYPDAIAQLKVNGTRNVIYVTPEGAFDFWKRNKERHKGWTPSDKLIEELKKLNLPKGYWHVIDSESLHLKNPNYKDTLYLFDILVYKSEYLIGKTYAERYELFRKVAFSLGTNPYFNFPEKSENKIFLARNYQTHEWDNIWEKVLASPICEGLVLKRTGAISRLETGWSKENNVGWQAKCRCESKNYVGIEK